VLGFDCGGQCCVLSIATESVGTIAASVVHCIDMHTCGVHAVSYEDNVNLYRRLWPTMYASCSGAHVFSVYSAVRW